MAKHDAFIATVNALKIVSPTISAEQRVGLLEDALLQYGLSIDEAFKILDASGLIVGEKDTAASEGGSPFIFKFPNDDEATSIPELAALMAKNPNEATDALYRGYLESSLGRAGEMRFATAAQAVAKEFPNDRELGRKVMVQILRGKIEFEKGSETGVPKQLDEKTEVQRPNEAETPKQLAHLIDRNWEQAKTLLYNGSIAIWLEYIKYPQLAGIAKTITDRYNDDQDAGLEMLDNNDQDIGLEMLVQALDPHIGQPELEVSHIRIDFGTVDAEAEKTIQVEIKNVGRGFLYGNVQLASELPGFQLVASPIRGEAVATVELDASHLVAEQMHETALVVSTNSGNIEAPISCYVDHPIAKSIRRVLISGIAVAMVALIPRLIVRRVTDLEWLSTRWTPVVFDPDHWKVYAASVVLCIGIFAYIKIKYNFTKNFGCIRWIGLIILCYCIILSAPNIFVNLDTLFYLGFDAPVVAVWAFWGFVIGTAIQGCREMKIYGRKGIGVLIAMMPVILLILVGAVKN